MAGRALPGRANLGGGGLIRIECGCGSVRLVSPSILGM